MSAPAHTPGPWSIVPYGDGDSLAIHHNDTDRVCFMATHGGSEQTWRAIQANANLIAAAPDMYAALNDARDMCSRYADFIRQNVRADDLEMHPYLPDLEDVVTAANTALARARGESA
jgi:hypothetical protein